METTLAADLAHVQNRRKRRWLNIGHGSGSSAIDLLRIGRSVHRTVLREQFRIGRTANGHARAINRLVARRRSRSCGKNGSSLTAAWSQVRSDRDGGRDRKNRPSQGVRLSQNTECIVGRRARYKVYEGTNITQFLTHGRWLTPADASFFSSA